MTTDLWILAVTALWTLLLVFPRTIFLAQIPGAEGNSAHTKASTYQIIICYNDI